MRHDTRLLGIGEVARGAGMSVSRIRFYESRGVLSEPERQSGKRRYPPSVLRQLAIIDAAQRVGFSLDEIRDLVWSRGDPAHERLRQLALHKLPEIDRLIERATAVRRLLEICSVCTCKSITECRLLDDQLLPLAHPPADQALERRIAREAADVPGRLDRHDSS
jgi:MerR family transcriptional regulator, redox-sensitive transcriptional activator SoxR